MSVTGPQAQTGLARLAELWRAGVAQELPAAAALRRRIHADPWLSGEEEPTARLVAETMDVPTRVVAETGRVARLGPASGPSVALRAELDALPITEATGAPFAARSPGRMHACGHDVHLAALTAVARAGVALDLPVGLTVLLQPREEAYPSGAADIVASGELAEYDVRCAVAAHLHPQVPVGSVAVGASAVNAAADEFEIVLTGQGGHAAYPHQAADVAAPLATIALGLPDHVRRRISPMTPALVSIGTLQAGDGAANVLPATGRILGSLRTTVEADRAGAADAIRRYATAVAAGYGVEAQVQVTRGEPVLANHPLLAAGTREWLSTFGFGDAPAMRSLGADDFSFFAAHCPILMAFVGVQTDTPPPAPTLHDPRFLPPEDAIDAVAQTLIAGYLAGVELIRT